MQSILKMQSDRCNTWLIGLRYSYIQERRNTNWEGWAEASTIVRETGGMPRGMYFSLRIDGVFVLV